MIFFLKIIIIAYLIYTLLILVGLIQSIINENESLESIIGHIIGFTILGYLLISNPTISDYFPTAITIDEFYYGNNNEFGQAENADLNEFVSSKKKFRSFSISYKQ